MSSASYEVAGKPLATIELPAGVHSIAYFCLTCGACWARIEVAGANWEVHSTPCVAHFPTGVADWENVPGSLLCRLASTDFVGKGGWAACVEWLPPALWQRELKVHIKHFYNKELE